MGFRTMMVTEDTGLIINDAFLEKYPYLNFNSDSSGRKRLPLTTTHEIKFYQDFDKTDLFLDIQRNMVAQNLTFQLSVVLLHECGGISLVKISKDEIVGFEPTCWKKVKQVEHNYCYKCTDSDTMKCHG